MFPNFYLPPLDTEFEYINNGREGSEEVSSLDKEIKEKLGFRDMDDKGDNEDLKKFIKEALECMTKHLMQGFELLGIQVGQVNTQE